MAQREEVRRLAHDLKLRAQVKLLCRAAIRDASNTIEIEHEPEPEPTQLPVVVRASTGMARVRSPRASRARRAFLLGFALGARRAQ